MDISEEEIKLINPFIKWVGGKTQIIDKIISKIPTKINTYYEPFIGGGSVLFAILCKMEKGELDIKKLLITDINQDLINCYNDIKFNHLKLISLLTEFKNILDTSKEDIIDGKEARKKINIDLTNPVEFYKELGKKYVYYYYRALYNSIKITSESNIIKSALFIFLNKTCFRGLYRAGNNGFNVPYGNYVHPSIFSSKQLQVLHIVLNKYDIIFKHLSFNYMLDLKFNSDDFIYLDPPYYPITKTSHTKYNVSDFNLNDHESIYKLCEILKNNNIKFLHSNSSCDYNTEKYKEFSIERIDCKRTINSKNPNSMCVELLISI